VPTAADLLHRFYEQIRLADRDHGPDLTIERDGWVHRAYPPDPADPRAMIESPRGLGFDPDAEIARQARFFTDRGQQVEWKTYSYDEPTDLGERLTAAGFVAASEEALLLGAATRLIEPVPLPSRYAVRAPAGDVEWDQVEALDEAIFGAGAGRFARLFRAEEAADPHHVRSVVVVDEASGRIVAQSVLRLVADTDFAGLWGGKVHPDHRGRGLYRAMTAVRARWALDAGHPICRVDALPTSRPVLERLGLVQVATTTPYRLTPPQRSATE